MRYQDLPQNPAPGVVLRCDACGVDYSATRNDYWSAKGPGHIRCGNCARPLQLYRHIKRYVRVSPARAEASHEPH